MFQEQDHLELLKLLSRYDALLEQLQSTMSEGFSQLGRANYHNKDSLRGRYGKDYWDESYEGHVRIQVVNGDKLRIKNQEEEPIPDIRDFQHEKTLKRRGRDEQPHSTAKSQQKRKDPITMFGGTLSTPLSLRQSQSHFKGSVSLMIELINCKRRIELIVTSERPIIN